ncbi:hypothetical protein HW555_003960 [Spodoptera exigua]|uniref:Thioredoxin domain-containing protein n=1 Tax=Spodoptera exigua TaxID=7107 RepID=A0A835GP08_SPOEX|nr:hypothetical protein HW555_003960 [Spodoptera exigua]
MIVMLTPAEQEALGLKNVSSTTKTTEFIPLDEHNNQDNFDNINETTASYSDADSAPEEKEQRKIQIKEDYLNFKKDYLRQKLALLKEQTEALKSIAKEICMNKCKEIVYDTNEEVEPTVEIVNASQLIKLLHVNPEITSRDMEADCLLVFFYARACPFSAKAAPHFNALARAFPDVKMVALDALKYGGTNTVYGIVGVPTLKVFHNGRPYGKFNGTEYNIQSFSKFLNAVTGKHAQSQVRND